MRLIRNILLVSCLATVTLRAQTTLQVITKSVRQEVELEGKSLMINLNKADLKISKSTSGETEVLWRIITKNSNKSIAEKESNFVTQSLVENSSHTELSYGLNIPKGYGKLKSMIVIEVEIKVQSKVPIMLKTQLTTVKIIGIENDINAELKFGKIGLINYSGSFVANSNFGDILCSSCSGSVIASLDKADFSSNNLIAKTNISSKFGNVEIELGNTPKLEVLAFRSKIKIASSQMENYKWLLKTKNSEIIVPQQYSKHASSYLDKHLFELNENKVLPKVSITNEYGDIIISKEPISITKK